MEHTDTGSAVSAYELVQDLTVFCHFLVVGSGQVTSVLYTFVTYLANSYYENLIG